MAFDFPASPASGDVFTPSGGPSWQYDGEKWRGGGMPIADAPSDGGEYTRVNGIWRLKSQTILPVGGTITIPVPATAKAVRLLGTFWQPSANGSWMRLSLDGSTFLSGAADYVYSGHSHLASVGFTNIAVTTANAWRVSASSDNASIPVVTAIDMPVAKAAGVVQGLKIQSVGYFAPAAAQLSTLGWTNNATIASATLIKALLIYPDTVNWTGNTNVSAEWLY